MPGINFVYDTKGGLGADIFQNPAAREFRHTDDGAEPRCLLADHFYYLSFVGYPGYPFESIEGPDWTAYIEGKLYGTEPRRAINELASLVFNGGGLESEVRNWLLGADGDFVVLLAHKPTGQIGIINDLFARLPLYYYHTDETLIVSRELRFIANRMPSIRFDRIAIAACLWTGYLWGRRTLLENVARLAPGTWIKIDRRSERVQVNCLHDFNFDFRPNGARSCQENSRALVGLLDESCRARAHSPIVVSLSGGFDSRAVAAGFHRTGISFRATTFVDQENTFAADASIAKQIANLFEVDWQLFQLPAPDMSDVVRLLRIKNGMNSLGMAFIVPYLDAVKNTFGTEITFITGAGGEALRDLRPTVRLTNFDAWLGYFAKQNEKLPIGEVSLLTGVPTSVLVDVLHSEILSYPEQEWEEKYIHFMFCERALKWLSEGEDRNRSFFWCTTPLHDGRFLTYVLGCPEQQKSDFRLYRELLQALSSTAAAIPHARWGVALTSEKFRIASRALAILRAQPQARQSVTPVLGVPEGYTNHSMIIQSMRQQMSQCHFFEAYLSPTALSHIVEHGHLQSKEAMQNLFTIMSTMELLLTGGSVLERLPKEGRATD